MEQVEGSMMFNVYQNFSKLAGHCSGVFLLGTGTISGAAPGPRL